MSVVERAALGGVKLRRSVDLVFWLRTGVDACFGNGDGAGRNVEMPLLELRSGIIKWNDKRRIRTMRTMHVEIEM